MKGRSNIVKLLFKMILYKPWLFLFNAVISVFLFTYNAIPIFITREILNRVSSGTGLNKTMIWLLAMLIGAGLARVALIMVNGVTYNRNMFGVANLIRRNIMEAVLHKKDLADISGSSGEAVNSFREDVAYCVSPLDHLLDIIGTTVYTATAIGFLIYVNPIITLFVFAPLAAAILIIRKVTDRIRGYRSSNREITSSISEILGDVAGSIQTIKVSGAQSKVLDHIDGLNQRRQKVVTKDAFFMTALSAVTDSTVHLGTAIILLFVAQSMKSGSFTVGDFSIFVYYLSSVADYMQRLGRFISSVKQSEVSFERIGALTKSENAEELVGHKPIYIQSEIEEKAYTPKNCDNPLKKLEVRGLTFKHPEGNRGIADISFHVDKGSFVVITGRVGSGKTTLLEVLLGLLPADSGNILWNGEPVASPHEFFTPPQAAYTSQVPNLFADTLKENILLGMPQDQANLDKAVHLAVLEEDIEKLEKGIDTVVGSTGGKLSGGQRQRVAIARMFARDPELLVFDDISSALDIETELEMWRRLEAEGRRRKSTCLVASNKKTVLAHADYILMMEEGRIAREGTLEQLIASSKEFRELWGEDVVVA